MTGASKDPVLVVLQLTGGNDYLNTIVPYTNPLYRDNRPAVRIPEEQVIPLDDRVGLHPRMGPMKTIYDRGDMAIIHGVGYPNSPRSHFRSMDIWHTCEPDKLGTEGWLGKAARDIDPNKVNVLTAVAFGSSLFRALVLPGVPVAVVDDLDTYGLLPGISEQGQRSRILDRFARLYSPVMGSGPVMDYLGQTGLDTLKGADILKKAPKMYSSNVEYPNTVLAKSLKGIAQVHMANFGTRIFYVDHGSFDSHSNQLGMHDELWRDVSQGVECFFDDLEEHGVADNVVMLMFSKYGSSPGRLIWPAGITSDQQENLYVIDEWMNRVSIFDKEGNFLSCWDAVQKGDDGPNGISGIAIGADKMLYITDGRSHQVRRFTTQGGFLGTWGHQGSGEGELNSPWGLAVDAEGFVYVADHLNHRVQKLTPDGRFVAQFGGPGNKKWHLNCPTDVAVDPDGDVYICDWSRNEWQPGRIKIFDAKGKFLTCLEGDAQQLSKWAQMTVDANTDYIKRRREVRSTAPEWAFALPTAVEFDAANNRLLVADTQRDRIQIYNKLSGYLVPQLNL